MSAAVARSLAVSATLLALLALAGLGDAASRGDAPAGAPVEVLRDAEGDQGVASAALDLRAVTVAPAASDDATGTVHDLTLTVQQLAPTDVADYRVTWTAASAHDPSRSTSERGVDIALRAGAATWTPILLEEGAWTPSGASQDAVIEGATFLVRGAPSGGGAFPHLSRFHAAATPLSPSRLLEIGALAPADVAEGEVAWTGASFLQLVPLAFPARAPDFTDPVEPRLGHGVDIQSVWMEARPDGFHVTFQTASLAPEDVVSCEWWRIQFYYTDAGDGGYTLFAYPSLQTSDGVVRTAFLGGQLEEDRHAGVQTTVVGNYTGFIELGYGAPGLVRLRLQGPAWPGAAQSDALYRSAGLQCTGEGISEQEDRVSENPSFNPFSGSNAPFSLTFGAMVLSMAAIQFGLALRRR